MIKLHIFDDDNYTIGNTTIQGEYISMELPNPISLKKIEMKYNENNINNYPSKINLYGYITFE